MKVALVTFHSAYNFGSILQAYATQEVIQSLGHEVEILNYRMPSQRNFYCLFPLNIGKKAVLNRILALPTLKQQIQRAHKFEWTINNIFNLTEEFREPEDAVRFENQYDLFISGSDQVISCHSNELKFCNNWRKYISPYVLEFTSKKKISFASSPNLMTDQELEMIKPQLEEFDYLSCREETSSKQLSRILHKDVSTVLDPTLMLNKESWLKFLGNWANPYTKEKYIFYYVLKGTKELNRDLRRLVKIAEKLHLKIVTSSPLSVVFPNRRVINAIDAGVYDFLGLIHNAEYVITDSYHGTLFSLNLEKNFYSLQRCAGANQRVEQMAQRLGFSDRIIYSLDDADLDRNIDYIIIDENRKLFMNETLRYLSNALEG